MSDAKETFTRPPEQHGTALAETVMVLPLVLVVVMLVVNVGAIGIAKIRSLTASREAAFHYARQAGTKGPDRDAARITQRVIAPQMGRHTSRLVVREGAHNLRARMDLDSGVVGEAAGYMLPVLSDLGGVRTYVVEVTPAIPYRRLTPFETGRTTLVMDDAMWTYAETGDLYMRPLADAFKWIGDVFR